jgi:hypothetical protein
MIKSKGVAVCWCWSGSRRKEGSPMALRLAGRSVEALPHRRTAGLALPDPQGRQRAGR